jgi:serine protease AprX
LTVCGYWEAFMRGHLRLVRRICGGLATTCTVVFAGGVATPALAAQPSAYVPAGLLAAAQQDPGATFDVIVQGSSPGRAAAAAEAAAGDARGQALGVRRQFATIAGASARLTGKQLVLLAHLPGVSAITPDAEVKLVGGLSNRQEWPFVAGVVRGWPLVTNGTLRTAPTIAIVDSGIAAGRSDFGGRVVREVTMTSLGGNSAGDGYGHGTFVAGIAAGSATGYTGAAPSAGLLSIDVMDDSGMALTSDVIAAADWIYQNKAAYNIRVANFSLHSTATASVFWDPLDRAVEKLWLGGVVVVAAAGNYGVNGQPSGVLYAPGNDPFVITVGANDTSGSVSTTDDKAAPWSAYGYTLDGFAKPELAAPGRHLVGPVPAGSALVAQRPASVVAPGYMELSGTSFAAPVVAGAAAYLLALHPSWTPGQVKGALMLTAKPVPSAAPVSEGVGEVDAARANLVAAPPNPNLALERFLAPDPAGGSTPVFDAASWGSAAQANASWGSASWGSASWGSAAWSAASWGSLAWSSASWGTASWGSASWGSTAATASWGSASWGSTAVPDNAVADAGAPSLLDAVDQAAAAAELGLIVNADGSVALPASTLPVPSLP